MARSLSLGQLPGKVQEAGSDPRRPLPDVCMRCRAAAAAGLHQGVCKAARGPKADAAVRLAVAVAAGIPTSAAGLGRYGSVVWKASQACIVLRRRCRRRCRVYNDGACRRPHGRRRGRRVGRRAATSGGRPPSARRANAQWGHSNVLEAETGCLSGRAGRQRRNSRRASSAELFLAVHPHVRVCAADRSGAGTWGSAGSLRRMGRCGGGTLHALRGPPRI